MKVSVIIPIRNSSSYILKAVSSVSKNNNMDETEIILVDDDSDDILDVKKIFRNVSYVKIIEKIRRTNAAHSRNIGIENSSGEYLFFLDSDDYFLPSYISKRIEHMDKFNSAISFGPYMDEISNGLFREHVDIYNSKNDMREFLFVDNGDFRSSTLSINKRKYKGTLFDSEQYKHQDWGFAIRCFDNDEELSYDVNNPGVYICKNIHSQMSSTMNISASNYFIAKYLIKDAYVVGFIKRHFAMSILLKDRNAISFFKGLKQYKMYVNDNKKNKILNLISSFNLNISSWFLIFIAKIRYLLK